MNSNSVKPAFIIAFLLCSMLQITAVSIVYNLRIAETTKRQAQSQEFKNYSLAAVVAIDQIRKRFDGHCQNVAAGLGTIIHVFGPFYVRADFAVGNVRDRFCRIKFSRTQTDDVVVYGGYSHALSKYAKATVSALVGIPTHHDSGFQGIQFGTGHLGVGGQIDTSYRYTQDMNHALLGAFRYIRFFPTMVDIDILNVNRRFSFNIGNLVDLLIGHNSRIGRHSMEFGYNATFAFGATLEPSLDLARDIDFILNNFYFNYRYFFLLHKHPSAVAAGTSWGFNSKPKTIGFKSIFTLWGSWGIAF